MVKKAFFAQNGKKAGIYPFLAKRGISWPRRGLFYINPSRRGPVPVPGTWLPRASGAPARRVSHSGVEVAEREPMGSRRDGRTS